MPLVYDRAIGRWRYQLHRIVDHRRIRANKLLPPGWTRAQREAFDRRETARLLAHATGAAPAVIDDAVIAYLRRHAPGLKNRYQVECDLELMQPWYAGRLLAHLPDVCREYLDAHQDLAPATQRKRISYLRAACRWAWKHEQMGDHDPGERVYVPQVRNERQRYVGRADVLRIARRLRGDARAAVLAAFYSGMRLGEMKACRVADGRFALPDTKNGSPRLVPAHPALRAYLHRFPLAAGKRTIQQHFTAAVARLPGLEGLHFHDLRHSAASAMVNAGIDLYTVGAVLGHRSAASTKRYAHLATATLEAAVGKIGRAA